MVKYRRPTPTSDTKVSPDLATVAAKYAELLGPDNPYMSITPVDMLAVYGFDPELCPQHRWQQEHYRSSSDPEYTDVGVCACRHGVDERRGGRERIYRYATIRGVLCPNGTVRSAAARVYADTLLLLAPDTHRTVPAVVKVHGGRASVWGHIALLDTPGITHRWGFEPYADHPHAHYVIDAPNPTTTLPADGTGIVQITKLQRKYTDD